MEELKISILDKNDYMTNKLKNWFIKTNHIFSIDEIKKSRPDLLIVNFSVVKKGCILKNIEKLGYKKRVLFLSEYETNECCIDFIPYNIDLITLKKMIGIENSFDKKIYDLLSKIGVPRNLKGYQYLKDSIDFASLGETNITDLYDILADIYNTSSKNIERSIRNAIEVSWTRANIELITKVFGKTLSIEKDRPTNSEYIYTLYEFIRLID
jgi:hypothetical protein